MSAGLDLQDGTITWLAAAGMLSGALQCCFFSMVAWVTELLNMAAPGSECKCSRTWWKHFLPVEAVPSPSRFKREGT
jgi:hypothetical protein